ATVLHRHERAGPGRTAPHAVAAGIRVVASRVELGGVRNQPVDLGHGDKLVALDVGCAAGYQQARFGPGAADLADRLARLSYRLCGYRAAVDDHDVALVGQHPPNRFAFGNVQPATQRNDFGAHAKSPQSKVPRKLSVAGPVMVMCPSSPQAISNAPP